MVRVAKLGRVYKRQPEIEIRVSIKQVGQNSKEYDLVLSEPMAHLLLDQLTKALGGEPQRNAQAEDDT